MAGVERKKEHRNIKQWKIQGAKNKPMGMNENRQRRFLTVDYHHP